MIDFGEFWAFVALM